MILPLLIVLCNTSCHPFPSPGKLTVFIKNRFGNTIPMFIVFFPLFPHHYLTDKPFGLFPDIHLLQYYRSHHIFWYKSPPPLFIQNRITCRIEISDYRNITIFVIIIFLRSYPHIIGKVKTFVHPINLTNRGLPIESRR